MCHNATRDDTIENSNLVTPDTLGHKYQETYARCVLIYVVDRVVILYVQQYT